ncbi:hypothetical protein GCK72_022680 [Caenorhabditis remanei]|uniref:Homeobox domain-containing protein n=1 Tax=Caenorhabditis remanei TaxID=31234 RepID=A0A6A5FUF8_CAERE|nr:hypothetical protein GCK72_022680 [Caenorhabditis remanei]KAF1746227.1 hypothetical protein GCK72_022680 [Caenorhabditis remanei]
MNEVFEQLLDKKCGPYVTEDDLKYFVDQLKETRHQVQKWFERKREKTKTNKNKNLHSSSKQPLILGSTKMASMATTIIAHQSISVSSSQIVSPPLWTPPPLMLTGPSIPDASNLLSLTPTSATVPSSLPLSLNVVAAPNNLSVVPNAETASDALPLIPLADIAILDVPIPPKQCAMTEEQINPDEEFPFCFVKKFAANNYICNACRFHVLQKSFCEPLTWEAKIEQLMRPVFRNLKS